MYTITTTYDQLRKRTYEWTSMHSLFFLRISLGVIFLWFGALKFFPELSPAQDLAIRTIDKLTWSVVPSSVSLFVLAGWECAIGVGLLFGVYMRTALLLLFFQMSGTFTSIMFFPQEMFTVTPYVPTLEGQYVIKNLVLISAGVVLGGALRNTNEASDKEESTRVSDTLAQSVGRRRPLLAGYAQRKVAVRAIQRRHEDSHDTHLNS
jgi:uncharacterized membrane protein YphA (DoxX/SURF4 family)